MKTINYYGQEVEAPDYAKFVATDANGQTWWYIKKPLRVKGGFSSGSNCGRVSVVINLINWRGSLKEC